MREEEEERVRKEEEERLREEQVRAARERAKREELKGMIREIQEEVQVKVSEQVVAMLQTFVGDVGVLLRHLLKGGETGGLNNETTMGAMRALQALRNFDLGESETNSDSDSDTDTDTDTDTDQSDTRKGSSQRRNTQYHRTCQCGKAVRQYQRGRYVYYN